jgi:phospholipid-binding lipoprotein MlaA
MSLIRPIAAVTLMLVMVGFTSGCATTQEPGDPRDPWEGFNRTVFDFNEAVDRAVIRPLAVGYVRVTPRPVRTGIGNFFSNLSDVTNLFNNLLQLKFDAAVNDFGRLAFNTTFGLLGLIDVASEMDLPKNNEDFGQTLGYWGVPPGPYVVLPLLGPSTVRDTPTRYVDMITHPLYYDDNAGRRNIAAGLMILDTRAGFLRTERALEDIAPDRYIALRDFYLDRREYLVHDGEPPGQDRGADLFEELEALEALEAEERRERQ